MGHVEGRGLGLNAQGPTKPVEESKQKGRRGLGFTYKEFTDDTAGWDFDNDPVNRFDCDLQLYILFNISIGTCRGRSSMVSCQ